MTRQTTAPDNIMTTPDLPGRLFDALVGEIRTRWPEYLHSRFTVAEIYQNLVPWRTHRNSMDIATSGEYEQALLRLLAGEGDYLALESQAARDEMRAELEARFPNTGLYRDFAAVGVRLNANRLPAPDAGPGRREAAASGVPDRDGLGVPEPEPDAAAEITAPAAAKAGPRDGAAVGQACSGCDQELPDIDGVRFCPFCGQDVRIVACPGCGMRVEAEWSYCVGCGRRARRG
jgi:hypothetical protein